MKLVDEMVTRYPDFVVSSSLSVIIDAATEDAKANFLLAESYRMLTNILKRFPTLTADNKAAIMTAIPSMVQCVVNVISSEVTTDVKSKRVKPILIFAKDFIQFLKAQLRGENAETLRASSQMLKATFSSSNGPSHLHTDAAGPAVQKLFAQACSAAEGLDDVPDMKPTGRKKRGGKESLLNSEVAEAGAAVDDTNKRKSKKKRRLESGDHDDSYGDGGREFEVDYEKELVKMSRKNPSGAEIAKSIVGDGVNPEVAQKKSKKQRK